MRWLQYEVDASENTLKIDLPGPNEVGMEPGRELDALVAEKVMGTRNPCSLSLGARRNPAFTCECGRDIEHPELPCYSTDISAAWPIWLRLLKRRPGWALGLSHVTGKPCVFDNGEYDFLLIAEGETFPHAICLAALKAKEVPNGDS